MELEDSSKVLFRHSGYSVRRWRTADREAAAEVIKQCLESYGLEFEPEGADKDALEVEEFYQKGEFWVVVDDVTGELVGTAGYYELDNKGRGEIEEEERTRSTKIVEIRKMYLASEARGKKLGRRLLQVLPTVFVDVHAYLTFLLFPFA